MVGLVTRSAIEGVLWGWDGRDGTRVLGLTETLCALSLCDAGGRCESDIEDACELWLPNPVEALRGRSGGGCCRGDG